MPEPNDAHPQLTLLIVEDQAGHRRALEAYFSKYYRVVSAEHGRRAIDIASQQPIHLIVTDLILPGMTGLDLLKQLRNIHPYAQAIVITAHPTLQTAVSAIKNGAVDYIAKPFDLEDLKAKLDEAAQKYLEQAATVSLSTRSQVPLEFEGIIGNSQPMQDLYRLMRKVCETDATVLITGESGTGKELVARAIHQHSRRAKGPFVPVSCAAIPETLLESELFGHERHAFTGAHTQRIGRFELANNGTLFLDEIGEISPAVQVKLLRVLQHHEFERLGGTKTIRVDVRVIAATNKDLKTLVAQNVFREDLYYRLAVIELSLPPLRERTEDIPLLVEHFLRRYNERNGKHVEHVPDETMKLLLRYSWPGNVRELENTIERAVVLAEADSCSLTPDLLPKNIRELA